MVPFLCFILLFSPSDDSLEQAIALINEGDLYTAEGVLLTSDPDPGQIHLVGAKLTEIALRLGNPEGKIAFYQSYLTRSRNWRGVSLYVLSALSARLERWPDFENYATTFFQEYRFETNQAAYPLIYYLARFSSVSSEKLALTGDSLKWFLICRKLEPERVFPTDTPNSASFFLRNAHHLEGKSDFDILEPGDSPSLEDRYAQLLLSIHKALIRDEPHLAAQGINSLYTLDAELNNPNFSVYFYRLLKKFFDSRGQAEQAATTQTRLDQISAWTQLPYRTFPDRARVVQAKVEDESKETQEEPVVDQEINIVEPEINIREEMKKPVSKEPGALSFEALEEKLLVNHRGLELAIRKTNPNTTFKKIYKNYLLGLYYIKAVRLTEAYEHLNLAQRLVVDYPFPNLETKVMLALADYHQVSGNGDRANWHRIQAAQIWDTPEHLPIFSMQEAPKHSPYLDLIDNILRKVTTEQSVHSLLYYSEMAHFQELRRKAYQRQLLSANRVISNQIQRTGNQLFRMTQSLAENPDHNEPASNYNRALELWNRLWTQVLPFYQDTAIPSISELQRVLNNRDRLLTFVEGKSNIGLLVVSKENAFAVGLGSKANLQSMSPEEQFDFLEGRLGTVWETGDAPLILRLSPSFQNDVFIGNLEKRMTRPENLNLQFSLKALISPKRVRSCRKTLIFSSQQDKETGSLVKSLPQAGLDWFFGEQATRKQIEAQLQIHERLILSGSFAYNENGLVFETRTEPFPIHEVIRHNPDLCNLTLISSNFKEWVSAMAELEMISPNASMTIYLARTPEEVERFKDRKFGIYFPQVSQ